jgi:protocatechuate 3,4-dioxygenase beta subunit
MDEQVRLSRLRVSRRRALVLGGTVGLAGVLAACATGSDAPSTGAVTATAPVTDPAALLDVANTCVLAQEETQGPYWFDVDSIRSDIREGRPGLTLALALRVHDLSSCSVGGAVRPVPNSVVEIWHCDAGGVYSGFATAATGEPPPGRPPGAPNLRGGERPGGPPVGASSNGSYSSGNPEATPSDDGTYLRGAQAADANGVVRFTTIYPGWYPGRTTHIHCKVHLDRRTVLTTQLYFDDNLTEEIYRKIPPYTEHTVRDTRNDTDSIYADVGLMTTQRAAVGYLAAINLGLDL